MEDTTNQQRVSEEASSSQLETNARERFEAIKKQYQINALKLKQSGYQSTAAKEAEAIYKANIGLIRSALDEKKPLTSDLIKPSPLHYVVMSKHVALVKDILSRGQKVEINYQNPNDGRTALHEAVDFSDDDQDEIKKSIEIIKLLIQSGANLELKSLDVIFRGYGEAVVSGSVQVYSSGGRTALHIASEKRNLLVCKLLIDNGAESLIWDNDGNTPYDLWMRRDGCSDEEKKAIEEMGIEKPAERKNIQEVEVQSRNRISRMRSREKERQKVETNAIVAREYEWKNSSGEALDFKDWIGMHPEKVFDDQFLAAIRRFENGEGYEPIKQLLTDPLQKTAGKNHHLEQQSIFGFSIFKQEFGTMLMESLDDIIKWSNERGIVLSRGGSKYGVVLNNVGWQSFFDKMMIRYLQPLAEACYGNRQKREEGSGSIRPFVWQHSFLVKYEVGKETRQHTHVDDSDLTVNICLGKEGFKGGDLYFYGTRDEEAENRSVPPRWPYDAEAADNPPWSKYKHQVGRGVFHQGNQYHGVDDITYGERCNLIVWCRMIKNKELDIREKSIRGEPREGKKILHWKNILRGWKTEQDVLVMINKWINILRETLTTKKTKNEGEEGIRLEQVDDEGRNLIHFCVLIDSVEGLREILKFKKEMDQKQNREEGEEEEEDMVNRVDGLGWTALHYTAAGNQEEMARVLLEEGGAKVNVVSTESRKTRLVEVSVKGQSSLHVACGGKVVAKEVGRLLIEKGARVDLIDEKGSKAQTYLLL
eukprot:TRINITY_DN5723_c0_g1_i1.p1 TRINITY_DN5723_c0_g1~~TRINITY_DN5723_c0_g1_i1.p1  ORF type:complete len:762 (+),score=185.85 TRINITY_DN5723_c0_g1_i1:6-2291(+)